MTERDYIAELEDELWRLRAEHAKQRLRERAYGSRMERGRIVQWMRGFALLRGIADEIQRGAHWVRKGE